MADISQSKLHQQRVCSLESSSEKAKIACFSRDVHRSGHFQKSIFLIKEKEKCQRKKLSLFCH
jgi:hypothetical protein